jgi:hypothetical protein
VALHALAGRVVVALVFAGSLLTIGCALPDYQKVQSRDAGVGGAGGSWRGSGGATGNGGATGTGGATGAGGARGMGGVPATGGAQSKGGAPGTGGATGAGGTTTRPDVAPDLPPTLDTNTVQNDANRPIRDTNAVSEAGSRADTNPTPDASDDTAACGAVGEACCTPRTCTAAGATCLGGTCQAAVDAPPAADAPPCGASGEACCTTAPRCYDGLTCQGGGATRACAAAPDSGGSPSRG